MQVMMKKKYDRDKDGIFDVVDDIKDLINVLKSKNSVSPDDITFTEIKEGKHDYASWRHIFPDFLRAVGK